MNVYDANPLRNGAEIRLWSEDEGAYVDGHIVGKRPLTLDMAIDEAEVAYAHDFEYRIEFEGPRRSRWVHLCREKWLLPRAPGAVPRLMHMRPNVPSAGLVPPVDLGAGSGHREAPKALYGSPLSPPRPDRQNRQNRPPLPSPSADKALAEGLSDESLLNFIDDLLPEGSPSRANLMALSPYAKEQLAKALSPWRSPAVRDRHAPRRTSPLRPTLPQLSPVRMRQHLGMSPGLRSLLDRSNSVAPSPVRADLTSAAALFHANERALEDDLCCTETDLTGVSADDQAAKVHQPGRAPTVGRGSRDDAFLHRVSLTRSRTTPGRRGAGPFSGRRPAPGGARPSLTTPCRMAILGGIGRAYTPVDSREMLHDVRTVSSQQPTSADRKSTPLDHFLSPTQPAALPSCSAAQDQELLRRLGAGDDTDLSAVLADPTVLNAATDFLAPDEDLGLPTAATPGLEALPVSPSQGEYDSVIPSAALALPMNASAGADDDDAHVGHFSHHGGGHLDGFAHKRTRGADVDPHDPAHGRGDGHKDFLRQGMRVEEKSTPRMERSRATPSRRDSQGSVEQDASLSLAAHQELLEGRCS